VEKLKWFFFLRFACSHSRLSCMELV